MTRWNKTASFIRALLLLAVCVSIATGAAAVGYVMTTTRDGVIYEVEPDAAYIVDFVENAELVLVPATLDGKPVKYRLREEWKERSAKKLIVGEGVTSVEAYQFQNWTVGELSLPGTLKVIGEYAFAWSTGFQTLVVPEGVERINNGALSYMMGVQTIYLPGTVRTIETSALNGNADLKEFIVDEANQNFCVRDGALYSKDGKTLIKYAGGKGTEWTIPEGTTMIAEDAFTSADLEILRIGEGLEILSNYAIASCYRLGELYLPASLQEIEESAFPYVPLQKVEVAEGSAHFEADGYALYQTNGAELIRFYNNEATSYAIRPGTKRIWPGAFADKDKLESVTIPRGVTTIEENTFGSCYSLSSVQLPITLQEIKQNAFANCLSLQRLALPPNVTRIEGWAFTNCIALARLQIPESMAEIEDYAFSDCPELLLSAKPGTYGETFARLFNAKQKKAPDMPRPLYGIVANDNKEKKLDLQSTPGANRTSIGQYQNGTAVRILSSDTEWLHVAIGEAEGYMESRYVFQATKNIRIFEPQYGIMKQSASALRYPLEGSGAVFSAGKDSFVDITETAGCFYQIQYEGMKGYVLTTDVAVVAPNWVNARVGVVANPDYRDRLNLRAQPYTNVDSLGRYFNGMQVEIWWEENEEWVYVRVGQGNEEEAIEGYMMKKYLDETR